MRDAIEQFNRKVPEYNFALASVGSGPEFVAGLIGACAMVCADCAGGGPAARLLTQIAKDTLEGWSDHERLTAAVVELSKAAPAILGTDGLLHHKLKASGDIGVFVTTCGATTAWRAATVHLAARVAELAAAGQATAPERTREELRVIVTGKTEEAGRLFESLRENLAVLSDIEAFGLSGAVPLYGEDRVASVVANAVGACRVMLEMGDASADLRRLNSQ